jgi:hypothetical protein
LCDEQGFALVLALGITVILAMSAVTVISSATSNTRSARTASLRQGVEELALAGINDAAALLSLPSKNALNPNVFCVTLQPPPCSQTVSLGGGTVTFSGVLNGTTWTITSTATLANRNGLNSGSLTRTMTAQIPVIPTLTQPLNNPAWNYIYATHPATPGACDMTIQQSVIVASPLFVTGNLCLQNTAVIASGPLDVRGSLTLSQAANSVGTALTKVSDVHIAAGCKWKNNAFHDPCQGGVDNVWANVLDTTPAAVSPPVVYWDSWYLNAGPGPYFPCTTTSGTPPTFDNLVAAPTESDAVKTGYRNDSAGTFNLTPASSYTCKTASGELSWNASTKTLTAVGTIFIDGSAYVNNGSINTYQGQATLYVSGTFLMKNSILCAKLNALASACDTAGWNPNQQMMCIVSNGNGSLAQDAQVSVGDSVQLVSAYFQGAVFATNDVEVDTTSAIDGPIVGSNVKLGQSVTTSFPAITTVPAGMPSNPTVYAQPLSPANYSG